MNQVSLFSLLCCISYYPANFSMCVFDGLSLVPCMGNLKWGPDKCVHFDSVKDQAVKARHKVTDLQKMALFSLQIKQNFKSLEKK